MITGTVKQKKEKEEAGRRYNIMASEEFAERYWEREEEGSKKYKYTVKFILNYYNIPFDWYLRWLGHLRQSLVSMAYHLERGGKCPQCGSKLQQRTRQGSKICPQHGSRYYIYDRKKQKAKESQESIEKKSVFDSGLEQRINYIFEKGRCYPNMALSSFMKFTKLSSELRNYFLLARVDRLYIDPITGFPWLGIEIQFENYYHNEIEAKERDHKKRKLFELAEIPLGVMKIYGQIDMKKEMIR